MPPRAAASFWAVLFLGLGIWAPAHAVPFQIQTVDSIGEIGIHSSLAVDSRGRLHISYHGQNEIRYASRQDSTWSFETVDTDVGFYTSLALDAGDVPHICYFDSTNADVRYATRAPGYWVNELVDSTGSVGQYTSIALDPQGNPSIAYFDFTNGNLNYATRVNGTWSIEVADTVGIVGYYASLAFDRFGRPCLSYLDLEGGLKFARRTAAGWAPVMVEEGAGVGAFSSLALDTLGYGHISYGDGGGQVVKYAEETSLGWYTQTVDAADPGGAYTSLRLDAAMNPRISYIGLNKKLRYAARTGTGWDVTVVNPTVLATHFTSLALDGNGNPMISYYDELRANLKFADASIHLIEPHGGEFWMGGSAQNIVWTGVGPVDVYLSQDFGVTYTKVTATPDPYPVVAITVPVWSSGAVRVKVVRDSTLAVSEMLGTLTIAPDLSTPWWTKLVDAAGLTGFSPSIRLTSTGSPRIAYWSATDRAVRYASRAGGLWSTETVQSGLASRTSVPLSINAFGVPSIAYFDNTTTSLIWAYRLNGAWITENAVPLSAPAEHCSQALDSTARPRVAFYEQSPARLVLAARFGISWGTETVDMGDSVGLWNSLALDSLGHPSISYCDAKAGDLKFASKPGASWSVETVDAVGNVGLNTALVLDARENPHVSYVDASNGFLKYATKENGAWRIEMADGSGRVAGSTSIELDASGEPRIAYHDRVRGRLMVASRSNGFWIQEVVTPAVFAGTWSSMVLGPDGNPRLAYVDDLQLDLRYASSAIELNEIPPGTHWPVGAHRNLGWDGNGSVALSLSIDGGASFQPLTIAAGTGSYPLLVPATPSPRCLLRAVRSFPPSTSVSDTFAILEGVDLLSFRADQTPFGKGADVVWQTDPAVPDLEGYRLERALGGGVYSTLLALTTSTSYHDGDATAGTTYRLTAINGTGGEFLLGEAAFLPRKPLAAGPLPYRSGGLVISFATLGAGGGSAHTELRLYDVRGRLVRTIARGDYPAGFQGAAWDGRDDRGHTVPSGLYVLKSVSGGHEASLKIAVVR